MILTDREIKNSLTNGLIEISPRPPDDAYASTSVDLTLGPKLRIFKPRTLGIESAIEGQEWPGPHRTRCSCDRTDYSRRFQSTVDPTREHQSWPAADQAEGGDAHLPAFFEETLGIPDRAYQGQFSGQTP